jgi:hypothetical protein
MAIYLNIQKFYTPIALIALFAFELVFGIIWFSILAKNNPYNVRQVESICPDYWKYDITNKICLVPEPMEKNLGTFNANNVKGDVFGYDAKLNGIRFNDEKWTQCGRYTWANMYNIVWDGLTNVANDC